MEGNTALRLEYPDPLPTMQPEECPHEDQNTTRHV
jgi:hypothetical protein